MQTPINKVMQPTSLNHALRLAAQQHGLPRNELRILLQYASQLNAVGLISQGQNPIAPSTWQAFCTLCHKRSQGVPIAYLVGQKEFFSRMFCVTPDVLIPRPETEEWTEHLIETLQNRIKTEALQQPLRILDLCTGSGVIGITLAKAFPDAQVLGTDICPKALAVAQHNAKQLDATNFTTLQSDGFKAFHDPNACDEHHIAHHSFDVICSNPPYIAKHDAHLSQGDLRHEPQHALTDFDDGLRFYRHIAQHAAQWLAPNSQLWLEHGHDQQQAIVNLFENAQYEKITAHNDYAGTPRYVISHKNTIHPA